MRHWNRWRWGGEDNSRRRLDARLATTLPPEEMYNAAVVLLAAIQRVPAGACPIARRWQLRQDAGDQ